MTYVWTALALLFLLLGVWLVKLLFFKPCNIDHFFGRVMLSFIWGYPELLSTIRMLERFGIHSHNKKLSDESEAHAAKQAAKGKRFLEILRSYNRDKLDPGQQLSYDIMEWFIRDNVEAEPFRHHNYPVNQLFGVQNQLPTFMVSMHQVKNKRDARYYNIRLSRVRRKFEQVIESLKIREEKGVIPPKFVFEKVLAEMENFISPAAEQNILYTSLEEKLNKLKNLSSKDKAQLLSQAREQIEQSVYPGYRLLMDYFSQLEKKATTDAGVWKLPQGDEYYQALLKRYTTTELTAEEIHSIGLSEVERIHKQMTGILTELGYKKPLMECLDDMAQDPRFQYSDDEESRKQVLKDYQAIIDRVDANISHLFNIRPTAGVIVDRIPEFKEKTSPGAYYNLPAMDGSRPGIFSVNLLKMPRKYDMETLAVHEAIPGHHFQLAVQQELKGVPIFRRMMPFTAYAEGWALYAEKLAHEEGLFSDQYSVLGYLMSELFRAVRLVVDTGLHHKRWTREQAIDYMVQNSGADETNVVIEIERYIVMPGQATAYKIGELEMVRLRQRAMDELGEHFDIKEFHDVVLKSGSMPLKILADRVEEYIRSKKQPAAATA